MSSPLEIPNYQRFLLGEMGNESKTRSFAYRSFINPIWRDDQFGLHSAFRNLCRLRNHLMGVGPTFAVDRPEGNLYTLSRIQHYPTGGGFMSAHVDNRGADVLRRFEPDLPYIQLLLMLSKKGRDFEHGGGYAVVSGKPVFHEDGAEVGDIIVYDGNVPHGVASIDPHKVFDPRKCSGRFVVLVNLYAWNYVAPKNVI